MSNHKWKIICLKIWSEAASHWTTKNYFRQVWKFKKKEWNFLWPLNASSISANRMTHRFTTCVELWFLVENSMSFTINTVNSKRISLISQTAKTPMSIIFSTEWNYIYNKTAIFHIALSHLAVPESHPEASAVCLRAEPVLRTEVLILQLPSHRSPP